MAQALHGASLMQSALAHMWFSNTGPSYSPSGPGSYSPGGTGSSGSKYSARAAVPPELAPFLTPGPADSGPGSSSSSPGWHHQKGDAVNTSSHDREGPASGGGGGSLLDLTGLEGLFNHPEASGAMVKLARLAASLELRAHAQRYEPFLAGCPGLQGLTIPKVGGPSKGFLLCARNPERLTC